MRPNSSGQSKGWNFTFSNVYNSLSDILMLLDQEKILIKGKEGFGPSNFTDRQKHNVIWPAKCKEEQEIL